MHQPIPEYDPQELYREAEAFVRQCYTELEKESAIEPRLETIRREIAESGHYDHTFEELEHGARMAWRNSNRCVGRLFWQSLEVLDRRDCETPAEVHEACCEHLDRARNGGDIVPTISIFEPMIRGRQRVRIWNYQLLRYAGYAGGDDSDVVTGDGDRTRAENPDEIVGDPAEVPMTRYCQSRGWEGDGGRFDILPHVIQVGDDEPELFEVPDSVIEEVELSHPEYDWFADLDLRWYDVPVVSNMRLEVGGIQYTAAPFNGWYLATEIGARNFADTDRYDMLPEIADRLGLDTDDDRSLWKDEAVVELNRAVLHSYDEAGVQIVDHHTVTDQFAQFERNEEAAGRDVTGDWSWLIPPVSPATTQVFHTTYDDEIRTPNFFYLEPPAAIRE
ncbi:nitric oxide synthase oxygenase [Natrarchaeobaculum aegyptiacum]|uniref:Nitric oxide synthase oxygenase n=1 Tax=Natrarchaeobaculum aegyptiacum TaxID=745377 RepID=A0A2Z2HZ29_9EURY|nr:nitric oxide synthase oxygenase [Natrarchaeobaculum aegyptiacum]ARS90434.1 nitric oxide synthase oxygenase [Natrarchaeobaculum aegyptiacum]